MKGRFPLLPRKKSADKASYGHTLIVAGSDGMPGAALLSARAALISGSGLITLCSTRSVTGLAVSRFPELMIKAVSSCEGALSVSSLPEILRYAKAKHANAAVVGPGLSLSGDAPGLARELVARLESPCVLDADGINAFRGRAAMLKRRRSPVILTPHAREFERLFGEQLPDSAPARRRLVRHFAAAYGIILVAKGHRTLVSDGRKVYENRTGGPALAKGGSGDVLTGMMAAFLAQHLKPFEAASWAMYLHGKAGDRAARRLSDLSVTASSVLAELPGVFRSA